MVKAKYYIIIYMLRLNVDVNFIVENLTIMSANTNVKNQQNIAFGNKILLRILAYVVASVTRIVSLVKKILHMHEN